MYSIVGAVPSIVPRQQGDADTTSTVTIAASARPVSVSLPPSNIGQVPTSLKHDADKSTSSPSAKIAFASDNTYDQPGMSTVLQRDPSTSVVKEHNINPGGQLAETSSLTQTIPSSSETLIQQFYSVK